MTKMILLQCHDQFDRLAEFDWATDKISFLSKSTLPAQAVKTVRGWYSMIHNTFVAFYAVDNKIYFKADTFSLECTPDIHLTLDRSGASNVLSIQDNKEVLFTLRYAPPRANRLTGLDPTAFVEEEHFDFCLFISNIVNDPERRNLVRNQR